MFTKKFFVIITIAAWFLGFNVVLAQITNPISSGTFQGLFVRIADQIRPIAVVVAGVFIIYSGFLFVTAAGNEEKVKLAKKTFTWTVLGTAIVVGASLLANVIVQTIQDL